MKILYSILALLLYVTAAHAAVDTEVCSSADQAGCTGTQLRNNINEELGALSERAPFNVEVTGTDNLTGCPSPPINSYVNGMTMRFKPVANNTGPMDVDLCSIGPVDLVTASGAVIGAGEVLSTTVYEATYDADSIQWRLKGGGAAGGGGAPETSSYLTLGLNSTLTSERVLTAGTALGFTDGGANSTLTVNLTDGELTCVAALTSAADKIAYYTGPSTCALADLSTYARTLIDDADAATARGTLGLVIGTNVQAYDADLSTWAGLTPSANGQSLVTAANYAAMRGLLDLEAGTDFYSISGANAAFQPLDSDLTTWAGVSSSANGRSLVSAADYAAMKALLDLEIGTDIQAYSARLGDVAGATWNQGDLLYFNGTNLVDLAPGTPGQFLKTNGAGANPSWETIAGGGDLLSTNNLSDVANAGTARTNLGLAIGTNVQAFDADLTTWAGLTPTANAQSLVTAVDYAAMRALLDLEAGTDFYSVSGANSTFQPLDADLTTWASLTPSANGQSLVTAANYAAMRGLLDVEAGVDLQTYNARLGDIAGITWNQGDILYFNGTSLVDLPPGTSGQFLKTNGAGANPQWETLAGGGDLLSTNNLSDVASASTAFSNIKQAATESATGVVELATTGEAETGTDTTRAVTAAGLAAAISGKRTIFVPAGAMIAETTTGCAAGTAETTTNQVMRKTMDCDASTQEGAQFSIAMPKSWDESTITFRADWTATSSSGDVIWLFSCLATSNDDALDAAFGTEVSVTDTLLSTTDLHQSAESGAITASGTPAENDNLWCRVQRDADAGGDTLAADAQLLGVRVLYTTNAMTDD